MIVRGNLLRGVAILVAASLEVPAPVFAQSPPPAAQSEATTYNAEQLDALLAPIALYPDALLTQVLMACTYPLQVVDASRWLTQPGHQDLKGDALAKALEQQNWDPSVKSLVPFPQIVQTLNSQLDWMQQLGYAFATQQADVMNSVQRLRLQAQMSGNLQTTEQQRVVVEKETIIIEPANPQVVYVPVYNPTVVYGTWPYPAYPPVYYPPPPSYVVGSALVAGLAFATGVAVVGSLWGWARPSWYGGNVNVNVNRYNSINVNRARINSSTWRPPAAGVGGRPVRPPGGPVGAPGRPRPLPANAIGRPNVQVPGNLVNRPAQGNIQRPAAGGTPQRPAGGAGAVQRPAGGAGAIQRPAGGAGAVQRPAGGGAIQRPAGPSATQRPAGAFGGINDGSRAGQFGNRGAQSRQVQQRGGGQVQQRGGGQVQQRGGGQVQRGGGGRARRG